MNNSGARRTQPGTPVANPNYVKVFVQRDYSDGTSVKFQTRFPAELEGRVNIIRRKKFEDLYLTGFLNRFSWSDMFLRLPSID